MIVVCVDDHKVILEGLTASVKEILPEAFVAGFDKSDDAISFGKENGCDVLLCEIELNNKNGVMLAKEIKKLNPMVNIIFVTVCDEKEYAREVIRLKPSGYLTKPATKQQLFDELLHLRYPVDYALNVRRA